MKSNQVKINKNLSDKKFKISLLPLERLKNKTSNVTDIKVILNISYHKETFEFDLKVSTNIEETEFNMGDIIDTIFFKDKPESKINDTDKKNKNNCKKGNEESIWEETVKILKKNSSDYFMSYYLDNDKEVQKDERISENENIKSYTYYGKINFEANTEKEIYFKIPEKRIIYIKIWQRLIPEKLFEYFSDELEDEIEYEMKIDEEKQEKDEIDTKDKKVKEKGCGRIKEKPIGYAIYKVCLWKKIYAENHITLNDAAKIVEVPKKTLDDYENQIFIGKKHNFDFNENINKKMGFLKDFNKQAEKKEKKQYS